MSVYGHVPPGGVVGGIIFDETPTTSSSGNLLRWRKFSSFSAPFSSGDAAIEFTEHLAAVSLSYWLLVCSSAVFVIGLRNSRPSSAAAGDGRAHLCGWRHLTV